MFKLFTVFLNKLRPRKNILDVYTDGSHKGKWGSWAFVIVENNQIIHESSGRVRYTDSHRMEFQAAIEALSCLVPGTHARLHSDSRVLINCATKIKDRPNVHADQIDLLDELISKNHICWKWVKSHSGVTYNERCDQLCIQARS
ncbi:MAG: ribonuclease HI [Bdellovibrio sp.]|nr:ribonuclease HI [Bdellovibrio sp.]